MHTLKTDIIFSTSVLSFQTSSRTLHLLFSAKCIFLRMVFCFREYLNSPYIVLFNPRINVAIYWNAYFYLLLSNTYTYKLYVLTKYYDMSGGRETDLSSEVYEGSRAWREGFEVFYASRRQGDFTILLGLYTTQRAHTRAYASTPRAVRCPTAHRMFHYVSGISLPFEISVSSTRAAWDRQNHLASLNNITASFRSCIRIWKYNCFVRPAIYTYRFNN